MQNKTAKFASLAIIVDSFAANRFRDDRMVQGGYRALIDAMTPHVARLKEKHAAHNPHHYTIADKEDYDASA